MPAGGVLDLTDDGGAIKAVGIGLAGGGGGIIESCVCEAVHVVRKAVVAGTHIESHNGGTGDGEGISLNGPRDIDGRVGGTGFDETVQPPFLTPPGCIDFEHMDISHNV